MSNNKNTFKVRYEDGFEKLLEDLQKIGYTKKDAAIAGIRMLHKKEFPPYAIRKGSKESANDMSEEEICEYVLGGEIVQENGIKYCKIKQAGDMTVKVPLSAIRDQLK